MNNAQLINQDSGNTEWYTPPHIIEKAREVMGIIDLDPASSAKANEIVKADKYFTEEDDGLSFDWFGNIWLNHPFGRKNNSKWIRKLLEEYKYHRVYQACCITYAATSEEWFRPLLHYPMCFIHGRTNYLLPDGTPKRGVTKGSCVTYIGPNIDKFIRVFSKIGTVKL